MQEILQQLNTGNAFDRLATLKKIIAAEIKPPVVLPQFANNHIHTTYSFSPYSPTAAVYFARAAGLQTAGIMDHDSIRGAEEFIEAGEMAGIATTIGLECRVSVAGTPLEGLRINNPDQKSNAYMALHGIPHTQIIICRKFLNRSGKKEMPATVKWLRTSIQLCRPSGSALILKGRLCRYPSSRPAAV